ncbi:hypothetical protein QBC35DRAFT_553386 [Podospora australis]|uniref:Uncharacterized protein n=1 Tax=Podospora australis TaxID=1536484 RepID=A0AAN6WS63_9PEZI|nr:hypothetical protein QBC35DRAFT_553386 [Podospora australis]
MVPYLPVEISPTSYQPVWEAPQSVPPLQQQAPQSVAPAALPTPAAPVPSSRRASALQLVKAESPACPTPTGIAQSFPIQSSAVHKREQCCVMVTVTDRRATNEGIIPRANEETILRRWGDYKHSFSNAHTPAIKSEEHNKSVLSTAARPSASSSTKQPVQEDRPVPTPHYYCRLCRGKLNDDDRERCRECILDKANRHFEQAELDEQKAKLKEAYNKEQRRHYRVGTRSRTSPPSKPRPRLVKTEAVVPSSPAQPRNGTQAARRGRKNTVRAKRDSNVSTRATPTMTSTNTAVQQNYNTGGSNSPTFMNYTYGNIIQLLETTPQIVANNRERYGRTATTYTAPIPIPRPDWGQYQRVLRAQDYVQARVDWGCSVDQYQQQTGTSGMATSSAASSVTLGYGGVEDTMDDSNVKTEPGVDDDLSAGYHCFGYSYGTR